MAKCPSVLETRCGKGLYVRPGALDHVWRYPGVSTAIRTGVSNLDLVGQEFPLTVELLPEGMHWPVQRTAREESVGINEEIFFAYRENRSWPSPVIIDPEPPEVGQISLVVKWGYIRPQLVTAWFGGEAFWEPLDRSLSDQMYAHAIIFWRKHAFVWDAETMGTPFMATWSQVLAKQC